EIRIQKEVNKIPSARIKIRDGDPSLETFPQSNQELFIPGNEIEIKLGYNNQNSTLFKGIIISHANRITSKNSELVIECKDKAVRLTTGKKSRYFQNVSESDIEEEIIDAYGLEKEIEASSIQHAEAVQFNISDWDFILSR